MTPPRPAAARSLAALRLRYALAIFASACLVYAVVLYPWMMDWGSTRAERRMPLPGDEFIARPATQFTRAITIHAPAPVVWQWLVQVGQDRAGFYSYDWLENLTGADIHNGDAVRSEWQQRAVDDPVYMAPPEILGVAPGETTILRVVGVEPGRSLILAKRPAPYANTWATVLLAVGRDTTRLLVRERSAAEPSLLTKAFYDPAHFVMQNHLMRGVKARAEGQPQPPTVLALPARLGWAAAGLALFGLFLTKRGARRLWLLAPLAAALPAATLGRDLDAALAAFLAVGISLLGFLRLGRRWLGPFLLVGAAVMLALLLAADAYLVFGWAFGLIILGAASRALSTRHEAITLRVRRLAHRAA